MNQKERVKWVIHGINIDRLTPWEQRFIESVEEQSERGKILTDKQMNILEELYKEKGM